MQLSVEETELGGVYAARVTAERSGIDTVSCRV